MRHCSCIWRLANQKNNIPENIISSQACVYSTLSLFNHIRQFKCANWRSSHHFCQKWFECARISIQLDYQMPQKICLEFCLLAQSICHRNVFFFSCWFWWRVTITATWKLNKFNRKVSTAHLLDSFLLGATANQLTHSLTYNPGWIENWVVHNELRKAWKNDRIKAISQLTRWKKRTKFPVERRQFDYEEKCL